MHELWDSDGSDATNANEQTLHEAPLHPAEVAGQNILPRSDGSWEIKLEADTPAEVIIFMRMYVRVFACLFVHGRGLL